MSALCQDFGRGKGTKVFEYLLYMNDNLHDNSCLKFYLNIISIL